MDLKKALAAASPDPTPKPPRHKRLLSRPPSIVEVGTRDAIGRFLPGAKIPGRGRPPGIAAMVREYTGDGEELILHALQVMRGELTVPDLYFPATATGISDAIEFERKPNVAERAKAREWLADRGFGKSVDRIEIAPGTPEVRPATLTSLGADDARNFFALSRKLALAAAGHPDTGTASSAVVEGAVVGGRAVDPEPAGAGAQPAPAGPAGPDAG